MAAPVAQIDIQKVLGFETWTNRYLTDQAVGSQPAEDLATTIANAERGLYFSDIRINKIRIATLLENDDVFQVWDPNLAGNRTGTATDRLPLWNVVRIDFGAGLGRPSRKYLRGVLTEIDINGSSIASAIITGILTTYATAISNAAVIVDPQGSDLDGFSIPAAIAMRQMRRGSKRRSTPVI